MSPKVNLGLCVIMTCQCRFTLVINVLIWRGMVMMGSLCVLGQGGTWQISVPLLQFCHNLKLLCKIVLPVNPKGVNPEYSLERLMLKLNLQYFGHLMLRADSLEKTLMLGKDWGQEEKGRTEDEMIAWHHRLNGPKFAQTAGDSEGQGRLACAVHGVAGRWTPEQLNNGK